MNPIIQWLITTGISILALFIGRIWGLHDRKIEHDKKVLQAILKVIPSNGSILFIREYDFGGGFDLDELKDINEFVSLSKRPEFQFLDSKIESLRQSLVNAINDFTSFIVENCFPYQIQTRALISIKQPREYNNMDEYKKTHDCINKLADNICRNYDNLLIFARKKGVHIV